MTSAETLAGCAAVAAVALTITAVVLLVAWEPMAFFLLIGAAFVVTVVIAVFGLGVDQYRYAQKRRRQRKGAS